MPVTQCNLKTTLTKAWNEAKERSKGKCACNSQGKVNKKRSDTWINCLAEAFLEEYGDEHRVFWNNKDCKRSECYIKQNKKDFKRKEYLFDVMVGKLGEVPSRSRQANSRKLYYIKSCEWAIESEFNVTNSRELVIDMSKLVMAAATNKLFVISDRGDKNCEVLEQLWPIAKQCGGNTFLYILTHPNNWFGCKSEHNRPSLYKYEGALTKWCPL